MSSREVLARELAGGPRAQAVSWRSQTTTRRQTGSVRRAASLPAWGWARRSRPRGFTYAVSGVVPVFGGAATKGMTSCVGSFLLTVVIWLGSRIGCCCWLLGAAGVTLSNEPVTHNTSSRESSELAIVGECEALEASPGCIRVERTTWCFFAVSLLAEASQASRAGPPRRSRAKRRASLIRRLASGPRRWQTNDTNPRDSSTPISADTARARSAMERPSDTHRST